MNPLRLIFRKQAARALTCLLALALLGLSPAAAIEIVRTSPYGVTEAVDLSQEDGKLVLSLDQAILLALRNNLGLQVERYRRASAYEAIRRNLGIFDLLLSVNLSAFDETSPSASALDGSDLRINEGQRLDLQLDQLLPSGGRITFDWDNSRGESNSFFSGINPNFSVDMDVVFSQPLLRGLGKNATKRGLLIARSNSDISLETLSLRIVDTINEVEGTYWSLVESRQQLEVTLESLALAENLHRMNKVQVEVGTMAPLELTQSEVGVAVREEAVLRAELLVGDTGDRMRQLLNLEEGRLWTIEILPTTDPLTERIVLDVDKSILIALQSRSELRQQNLTIHNLEIESEFQRNRTRPQLDFQVRYGYNGLGGDVIIRENIFDPGSPVITIPGGYRDALEQVFDLQFRGWSSGFVFGVPIQNREARASSVMADMSLEEGRVILEDLELQVKTGVRRTVRGVQMAAKAIDLATISRQLEEKNLDATQKRYENGLATSFQVLEIQEDLSEARSREVTSITGYRRALILYYIATGKLLEENGVQLDDSR